MRPKQGTSGGLRTRQNPPRAAKGDTGKGSPGQKQKKPKSRHPPKRRRLAQLPSKASKNTNNNSDESHVGSEGIHDSKTEDKKQGGKLPARKSVGLSTQKTDDSASRIHDTSNMDTTQNKEDENLPSNEDNELIPPQELDVLDLTLVKQEEDTGLLGIPPPLPPHIPPESLEGRMYEDCRIASVRTANLRMMNAELTRQYIRNKELFEKMKKLQTPPSQHGKLGRYTSSDSDSLTGAGKRSGASHAKHRKSHRAHRRHSSHGSNSLSSYDKKPAAHSRPTKHRRSHHAHRRYSSSENESPSQYYHAKRGKSHRARRQRDIYLSDSLSESGMRSTGHRRHEKKLKYHRGRARYTSSSSESSIGSTDRKRSSRSHHQHERDESPSCNSSSVSEYTPARKKVTSRSQKTDVSTKPKLDKYGYPGFTTDLTVEVNREARNNAERLFSNKKMFPQVGTLLGRYANYCYLKYLVQNQSNRSRKGTKWLDFYDRMQKYGFVKLVSVFGSCAVKGLCEEVKDLIINIEQERQWEESNGGKGQIVELSLIKDAKLDDNSQTIHKRLPIVTNFIREFGLTICRYSQAYDIVVFKNNQKEQNEDWQVCDFNREGEDVLYERKKEPYVLLLNINESVTKAPAIVEIDPKRLQGDRTTHKKMPREEKVYSNAILVYNGCSCLTRSGNYTGRESTVRMKIIMHGVKKAPHILETGAQSNVTNVQSKVG